VARLILDTTVLISAERTTSSLDLLIADEDDVAIAAITAAELLVGVELADAKRRTKRQAFVRSVLESIPIEAYDLPVAEHHARLLAHVRRSGTSRGAHDLLIAATALARGRAVVTADERAFRDLPGLTVNP
jgi:tRNA(fMet)-specific endonuclease VapC